MVAYGEFEWAMWKVLGVRNFICGVMTGVILKHGDYQN